MIETSECDALPSFSFSICSLAPMPMVKSEELASATIVYCGLVVAILIEQPLKIYNHCLRLPFQ